MSTDYHRQIKQIAAIRAQAVATMKDSGMTWAEIGRKLGISRQRAQQMVSRYMAGRKDGEDAR